MFRTKQQQKTLCGECGLARTADVVGDSSTLVIVNTLLTSPKRFNELVEVLSGTSTRTVSKKLLILEEKGIVDRKDFHEKPPHVEYSLTKKGKALSSVIKAMKTYGDSFLKP